jgi:hypothetical protein
MPGDPAGVDPKVVDSSLLKAFEDVQRCAGRPDEG